MLKKRAENQRLNPASNWLAACADSCYQSHHGPECVPEHNLAMMCIEVQIYHNLHFLASDHTFLASKFLLKIVVCTAVLHSFATKLKSCALHSGNLCYEVSAVLILT